MSDSSESESDMFKSDYQGVNKSPGKGSVHSSFQSSMNLINTLKKNSIRVPKTPALKEVALNNL